MEVEEYRTGVSPLLKKLFGRPLRCVLTAWILERGANSFTLKEAHRAMSTLDESASGVSAELRVLVSSMMLAEARDGNRVFFFVLDSPLWEAFGSIGRATGILSGSIAPLPVAHVSSD